MRQAGLCARRGRSVPSGAAGGSVWHRPREPAGKKAAGPCLENFVYRAVFRVVPTPSALSLNLGQLCPLQGLKRPTARAGGSRGELRASLQTCGHSSHPRPLPPLPETACRLRVHLLGSPWGGRVCFSGAQTPPLVVKTPCCLRVGFWLSCHLRRERPPI